MNRRLIFLLTVPAVVASCLAGCAKPTVVGKWQGNLPLSGQSLSGTIDFKPDNTMLVTTNVPLGPATGEGTYKVEGETLTMTGKSIQVNGKPLPSFIADRFPASIMNNTSSFKIDGDNLTLNSNGKDVSLTRVKDEAAK